MNRAGLDMLEAESLDQVKGLCIYPLVSDEYRAAFKAMAEEVFKGESRKLEFKMIGLKGRPRWLYTHAVPLRNEAGEIAFAFATTIDITERKETEDALRAAEEKYRGLIETTDTGFVIIDDKGFVVDANKKYAELCGRKEVSEVIGRSVLDWTAPYEQERNAEEVRKCVAQGYVRNLEIDYVNPSGKIMPVEINATLLRSGKSSSILGLCRGIAERKQAENVLRESEERFRKIFEEGPIGMIIAGSDYKLMKANKAFCTMLGYSKEELFGMGIEAITFEEDKEISRKLSRQLFEGEIPGFRLEKRYVKKDGEIIWANLTATAIHADDKASYGMGMVEDITARKRAEDGLREKEKNYRSLFEHSNDGIFIQDETGVFLECNRKGAEIFGYTKEDMIGRLPVTFDPDRHADGQLLSEVADEKMRLAVSGIHQVFEWSAPHADGRRIDVEVTLSRIRLSGKTCLQAIVRDVTERKRLEREILKSQKLEAIGTLAGGIAHDFNNLLQGIFGYISMAKVACDQPEKSRAMLDEAEQALHQAVSLTTQLLTFSKGGRPVKKRIEVVPAVERAAKFALSGSRSSYRIEADPARGHVDADEGQLGQVVQNIVLNADQAMPLGGDIVISVRNVAGNDPALPQVLLHQNHVLITISDTGHGIPAEYLGKIFDPYFTTKEKGSGLGLATSYSIIRNHGGLIDVTSVLGKGTTFFVYLPAAEAEEEMKETPVISSACRKGKILVMDDEDLVLKIGGEMIESLGHDVEFAKDGQSVIEKYRDAFAAGAPYDIVILDLTVRGGLGGKEAMRQLLEIDGDIKGIVSSGYSEDAVMAEYSRYGFKACLSKPYRLEKLRDTLNALLS